MTVTGRAHGRMSRSSLACRGGNLAKIPPNHVIDDFGRGSSVESESEGCPAGIIEHFWLFKMASKMATLCLNMRIFASLCQILYCITCF